MGRIDPGDVAKDLQEGEDRERRLRWDEAASFYDGVVRGFGTLDPGDRSGRAMRAAALLRLGNALMRLGRWEEARARLDDALHDAKASGQADVLAQALLGAGVFAAERGEAVRGEGFIVEALTLLHGRDDRASLQGRGWAFVNLGTLYGRTGRLDLAFVTLAKAREVLGAAQAWAGVAAAWEAQAQVRRGIGDEDRWREDLAEAVIFYDREGMKEKADQLRGMLGKKLV
ncbi:MAG: hypothetical protein A3K59_02500 [Euryarchaeota archaeon RBG_19FT_COMBO_69_17]|nr:MAG: hypothetical protein A3K59_02500 [Euryarchaeota archaeon RBG_19FT_COMBO_69_17]